MQLNLTEKNVQPNVQQPKEAPKERPKGASDAWLQATTALNQDELEQLGNPEMEYKIFLTHDPRAGDIWATQLSSFRQDRRDRMEEARQLGEEIENTKSSTQKVQVKLFDAKRK